MKKTLEKGAAVTNAATKEMTKAEEVKSKAADKKISGKVAEVPDIKKAGTIQGKPGHPKKVPPGNEPPAFLWKVVGNSLGVNVVLFKAVEKSEAEAQRERVVRDGFYTDVRLMDLDAKVAQPKGARKEDKPAPPKVKKASTRSSKKPAKQAKTVRIKLAAKPVKKVAKKAAKKAVSKKKRAKSPKKKSAASAKKTKKSAKKR